MDAGSFTPLPAGMRSSLSFPHCGGHARFVRLSPSHRSSFGFVRGPDPRRAEQYFYLHSSMRATERAGLLRFLVLMKILTGSVGCAPRRSKNGLRNHYRNVDNEEICQSKQVFEFLNTYCSRRRCYGVNGSPHVCIRLFYFSFELIFQRIVMVTLFQ